MTQQLCKSRRCADARNMTPLAQACTINVVPAVMLGEDASLALLGDTFGSGLPTDDVSACGHIDTCPLPCCSGWRQRAIINAHWNYSRKLCSLRVSP